MFLLRSLLWAPAATNNLLLWASTSPFALAPLLMGRCGFSIGIHANKNKKHNGPKSIPVAGHFQLLYFSTQTQLSFFVCPIWTRSLISTYNKPKQWTPTITRFRLKRFEVSDISAADNLFPFCTNCPIPIGASLWFETGTETSRIRLS